MKPKPTPNTVVKSVGNEFGCDVDHILQKGRKGNLARDVAIYLARELAGESGVGLGKYFGNISGAGSTVRYNHILNQLGRNRSLRARINRIKKKIINN